MKKNYSRSFLLSNVAVFCFVVGVAPLVHAEVTSSSVVKPMTAKSYNRALDADLIAAILRNDLSNVKSLLKDNADPNATSSDTLKTPALGCAATLGYLEIARVLVEAGADIEGADTQSNVPLMQASEADGADMICFLLQKGAKVDGDRKDGFTPLDNAAASGRPQAARALIAGGADINSSKAGLLTPLMIAALKGRVELVRLLLASGANVNLRLPTKQTALMYAAANTQSGNLEIVKMLVEAGADVSVVDSNGKKAREIATDNKLRDIEKYLVDIYNRDTALFNVIAKASREVKTATSSTRLANWQAVKDELAKGANPRYTDPTDGLTSLILLIGPFNDLILTLDDNDATMKTILARSDLSFQDKNGWTALHHAAARNNLRMIGWLIQAGVDLNIVIKMSDKNGTALDLVAAYKNQEAIALLKNAGAKTYAQLKNPGAPTATSSTRSSVATPSPPANTIAKSPLDVLGRGDKSELMQAAYDNDTAKIAQLLERGASLEFTDSMEGYTALFYAAFGRSFSAIKALVKAGANINALNKEGKTPLVSASFAGEVATIRTLVEAGADLKYLQAAINYAKFGKNTAVIEYLTSLKASGATSSTRTSVVAPNATSSTLSSSSPSSSSNNLKMTKSYDRSLDAKLIEAALKGDAREVEKLLARNADPNARETRLESRTALMIAASSGNGNLEIVKMLVNAGADVSAKSSSGKTADRIAADNKLIDVANYLVDIYNRDLALYNATAKAYAERNAPDASIWSANWQAIKTALAAGSNPRFAGNNGKTPLLFLAYGLREADDATCMAIIARSDLNAQENEFGCTALHTAVAAKNIKMVGWLIKADANLNIIDKYKRAPLDMFTFGKNETVALLKNAGAKTYAQLQAPNSATSSTRSTSTPMPQTTTPKPTPTPKPQASTKSEARTTGGMTALMSAASAGEVEKVRALIASGANVNARSSINATPLYYVCEKKDAPTARMQIVKMLVEAGADVSVKANDGKSADRIAADNRMLEIANHLVGIYNRDLALLNALSKCFTDRNSSLFMAQAANWVAVTNALEEGANPRFASKDGDTALMSLAYGLPLADDQTCEAIIARSDLDVQRNTDGSTALHIAGAYNNVKMVGWLIKAKADLNVLDKKGRTPLDIAVEAKNDSIAKQLRDAGAKTAAQVRYTPYYV